MSEKLKCPQCGVWTDVIETRAVRGKNIVYRRRECANGHRFFTHEIIQGLVKRYEKAAHSKDKINSKGIP